MNNITFSTTCEGWRAKVTAKYPSVRFTEETMKHTHRTLAWVGAIEVAGFKIVHAHSSDPTKPGVGWISW